MPMYHLIRNQFLDRLRRTTGAIHVVHRAGEDSDRLLRRMRQALGDRSLTVTCDAAFGEASVAPTDWVVPVHTVRSRFSRGDDRLSRWSRQLGERRSRWADGLNRLLGARVELVCGAPVSASDTAGVAAALASLRDEHRPPVMPTLASLWLGIHKVLTASSGETPIRAQTLLRNMANQYHLTAATLLRGVVHYLSRCFFRGIWTYGMTAIEALPANARIVYLPCHRSHFDYMVLPYALNELGQTCPIFAAGDNLNFFPIGRVLQTSFAFFIRRTFGNDQAYRDLCAAYLGEVLRGGVPISFFPEGGRSRDGWMRSPKLGMLQMCREQIDQHGDLGGPVYLVPVHLAYERCPDGKSLAKQSLGRAKRQESVFRFAKSLKMLVADHGRVFLSFGEPVGLSGIGGLSDVDAKTTTLQTARHLLQRINTLAVVTGPALVAVSLIVRGYQASTETLTGDSAWLAAYVQTLADATGWPVILAPDSTTDVTACRGVVRLAERVSAPSAVDEAACRHHAALLGLKLVNGTFVCTDPIQRAGIDWHLGAIGHLLAPLGLVARHLAQGGALTPTDLQALRASFDQCRRDETARLHWPEETDSGVILAGVMIFLTAHHVCEPAEDGGYTLVPAADPAIWQRWAGVVPAGDDGTAAGQTIAAV